MSRRACFRKESRLAHLRRRIPDLYKFVRGSLRVAREMGTLTGNSQAQRDEDHVIEEIAATRAEFAATSGSRTYRLPISETRGRLRSTCPHG